MHKLPDTVYHRSVDCQDHSHQHQHYNSHAQELSLNSPQGNSLLSGADYTFTVV